MKIYRVIREECTCYMACNTYQIHDIENIFLGRYRSIHTVQNDFSNHINEIPTDGARDIICHAILLHPQPIKHICRPKDMKISILRQI